MLVRTQIWTPGSQRTPYSDIVQRTGAVMLEEMLKPIKTFRTTSYNFSAFPGMSMLPFK
jgi:hypothetical protein